MWKTFTEIWQDLVWVRMNARNIVQKHEKKEIVIIFKLIDPGKKLQEKWIS